MTEKDIRRFWDKVNVVGHNDCWEWKAGRHQFGYGMFWLKELGQNDSAPRVAWRLIQGPIPEGEWVLHRCDNPPCCNPAHLFLGPPKANTQDMIAKGRKPNCAELYPDWGERIKPFRPTGEKHWAAKVTDEIVVEMRSWFSAGAREADLAYAFEVGRSTARYVLKQGGWEHLPQAEPPPLQRWCRHGHEYTEANTRWYRGKRYCRACGAADTRRVRERKKGGGSQ